MNKMKTKRFFSAVLMLLISIMLNDAMGQTDEQNKSKREEPVKIIWDTDMQWDWDDAGALAILHAMADDGEVEILGIGSSTRGAAGQWNPHTIDAINTYYRRSDIPIGKSLSGPSLEDMYGQWVSTHGYYYNLAPEQVWDDVIELYRKILSEQPDTSVVMVTVGYTSNMRDLLESESDEYSSLNGRDLIEQKVKFWSCMGGRYPSSGGEANFQDWNGDAKYSIDNFPRPILGTSSETGNVSGAGSALEFTDDSNPVKGIYRKRLDEQGYPNTYNHATWDLIATLVAARDPALYFDITSSGTNVITIENNGEQTNEWQPEPDNGYRYLIQTNPSYVSSVLDELIGREPKLPDIIATLTVFISGEGTVNPMGGIFDINTPVTLTATPAENYEFSGWTGDITGTPNPITFPMNKNKSITAVFIEASVINEQATAEKFALKSVPNPCSSSTNIHFKIEKNAHVKIAIFNTNGKEVAVLLDNMQTVGNHEVVLNTSGLATGTYYYTLQSEQYLETKKLIIQRGKF